MPLTQKQTDWLLYKNIKVNEFYMFPRWGFTIYDSPRFLSGKHMDTNPFTRSLDHEYFYVKEKVNGFCKGNFLVDPHHTDFYLHEKELSRRGFVEYLVLLVVCYVPMSVYNWVNKK